MKISILTPCFNAGGYLDRAVQSVLAQKDPDFEHIIADGGSTDGTVAILKNYPHLKWASEPDRGQCDAMNKAFSRSSGNIIAYLNADDWFEPGVGNFYSKCADMAAARLVVPVKDYRSTLLHFRHIWPLNPICYFYRRAVQIAAGPFPLEAHVGMDYWFLMRAMSKARILASDVVFGTYFFPPESKTSRTSGFEGRERAASQCRAWVREYLRQDNPRLLVWWNLHWWWYHYVQCFPERLKAPVRYLAYKALFASKVDYVEYQDLGFRKCYRRCFQRK